MPHIPTPRTPHIPPPRVPKGFWEKLKQRKFWVPIVGVLLFILLVVGSWYLTKSWLVAFVVGLSVALVVLVVVLVRMYFKREREERLARGIEDHEEAVRHQEDLAQQGIEGDLEGSFRRALTELRESRIDDVYALPWYLVIGESQSGKSDLIRHSGLELPAEYAHTRPAGPTRDCDFWLTNQAIVLDTAGRFVDSEEPGVLREWQKLLKLLKKHRAKFPLEGVVVALPITSLFGPDRDELIWRAQLLRRRFNELTDVLRVDVPIYVVVTKADRMEGFVEFANAMTADRWQEALGWTNGRRQFADAGEIATRGLAAVQERLEGLIPQLLLNETDPKRRRRLFLFPEEFSEVSLVLAEFLRSAFAPSVYDEVPFLRGVYFTSTRREGSTLSPVLSRLGHDWAQAELREESALQPGIFLRDLFREIVVGDRELALRRRWMGRAVRRVLVWSFAAVSLTALALLGVSFVDNLRVERRMRGEATAVVDGASSLIALERLRVALAEDVRQRIFWDGLGLGSNFRRARQRAGETFSWAYGREFESPTKNLLLSKIRAYDPDSFEALATVTLDLCWLRTRTDEALCSRPDLLSYAPIGRRDADVEAFVRGYDSFVRWLPERLLDRRFEQERDAVLAAAPRLLSISRLEDWSRRLGPAPVRYADFGLSVPHGGASTEVPGAYTLQAWDTLVNILVSGVEKTGAVASPLVTQFRAEYVERFDASWRGFLMDTPNTPRPLAKVKDSPYLALLERIDDNTRAELPRRGELVPWVGMLREVRREKPLERLEGEEDQKQELPPWQRYQVALAQVEADALAGVEQSKQALDLSRRMEDPEATSFGRALSLVRQIVPGRPDVQASTKLRGVLSLPILDGASAVFDRALEELDKQWVHRIARPFGGRLDAGALFALYSPSGGELQKFLAAGMDKFYADGRPRPLLEDRGLPLGPSFLGWMRSAEELRRVLYPGMGALPRINVRLDGLPTTIEGAPGMFVTRQDLRLVCDQGVETFVYRQGTGSHSFAWTPRCQELSLRIWARNRGGVERELTPRLERRGPLAFPQFLRSGYVGADRLQWQIQTGGLRLQVEYRLRAGQTILQVAHRPPPKSLRN